MSETNRLLSYPAHPVRASLSHYIVIPKTTLRLLLPLAERWLELAPLPMPCSGRRSI